MTILASGLEATVQDYPGRLTGLGVPRSGPVDSIAFRAANILAGNPDTTEGLEIVIVPGVAFEAQFHLSAVVSVTGRKNVLITVDGRKRNVWSKTIIPAQGKLRVEVIDGDQEGFRTYLAVRGGFPDVPAYLGSKSTSMGLGGFQGRSLIASDQVALGDCELRNSETELCLDILPDYPSDWLVYVLPGPQGDEEFVDREGLEKFYATKWRVSPSSNRMGIRLESTDKVIKWARGNGGEGGSHPSNILDNGYAPGTLNINGDTPVILTNEGPDMGGYVCICTVATADQ